MGEDAAKRLLRKHHGDVFRICDLGCLHHDLECDFIRDEAWSCVALDTHVWPVTREELVGILQHGEALYVEERFQRILGDGGLAIRASDASRFTASDSIIDGGRAINLPHFWMSSRK